jgi:alpha-glucosidase
VSSSDHLGRVVSVTATGFGAQIGCSSGALWIEVIGEGMIRVRATQDGDWPEPSDWDALLLPSAPPPDVTVIADDGTDIVVGDGVLRAEIERASSSVRLVTAAGTEIAADAGSEAITWNRDRVRLHKRRHPDERHAGFGERSRLDQTTGTKTFWNVNAKNYGPDTDPMYCTIPVFLAHRPSVTYGFILNTPGWARIHAEKGSDVWSAEVAGGNLDYLVVSGASPADVLRQLTAVIGRIELPPRWAIGYHQSRWGYSSAAELTAVAEEFTTRGLPLDALHVDIDYMNRHRVFTWDPNRFPDPSRALADLDRRGLHAVAIVDPGVAAEDGNPVYTAGLELDAFIRGADARHVTGYVWPGLCVFPDFLRPEVRRWWADLHAVIVDAGVAGVWSDMNEPALYDGPVGAEQTANVIEMPTDAVHNSNGRPVPHAVVHNVYGTSMARAANDALARLRPVRRSFALTRSGSTGVQRFAALWTGDNTSSWEHLRMSLPMLCNLGLSGIPFVGADIGGYFDDATPELFARWMQAGVLYPMMRAHSHKTTLPNEPWSFGEAVEAAAGSALRLRYQLRPYLYSAFYQAATTGAPVLRPLLWAFHDDPRAAATEDEVLLGDHLLAAPVMEPGARMRRVYFPEGRWYDWWSKAVFDGPTAASVDAPLDRLPLFARAGTAVPLATLRQDGTVDDSVITLRVFPGAGSGSIYDDDGESFAFRSGEFAHRSYNVRETPEGAVVRLSPTVGTYRPSGRRLRVALNGVEAIDVPNDWDHAIEVTLSFGPQC